MSDLLHASTLFLIFAAALACYGAILARTGNKNLLPYRAMHSVRGSGDVRRVGRAVVLIALAIGALALLIRLLARS